MRFCRASDNAWRPKPRCSELRDVSNTRCNDLKIRWGVEANKASDTSSKSAKCIIGVSADLLADEEWADITDWEEAHGISGDIWRHHVVKDDAPEDDIPYLDGNADLEPASGESGEMGRLSSSWSHQAEGDTIYYGDGSDLVEVASNNSGDTWRSIQTCSHVLEDEMQCSACLEANVRVSLLEEDWADTHEWNAARDRVTVAFVFWAKLTQCQSESEGSIREQPHDAECIQRQGCIPIDRYASKTMEKEESPRIVQLSAVPSTWRLDEEIVLAMAASHSFHQRILRTISRTKVALMSSHVDVENDALLYGSASLGRTGAASLQPNDTFGDEVPFITMRSDVDVVLFSADISEAHAVVESLKRDACLSWQVIKSNRVPRFSVAQWTFLNSAGVYLDLTCITEAVQYQRFVQRQRAFREHFWQRRRDMVGMFGTVGGDVFDAYIYLLKGFALCGSQQILTSFQAVCIGLFVLQRSALPYSGERTTALALFRNFLVFSSGFFGDGCATSEFPQELMEKGASSSTHGIHLSDEGSFLAPRQNAAHQAEFYFEDIEPSFGVERRQWMNVLHNLNSQSLHKAASVALWNWFEAVTPRETWRLIRSDLECVFSVVLD